MILCIFKNSAHACSEIGLKWFLFALNDLETVLGFVSVLDLFGYFVFLEHRRNGQNRIKTIFDHFRNTHARKKTAQYMLLCEYVSKLGRLCSFTFQTIGESLVLVPNGFIHNIT